MIKVNDTNTVTRSQKCSKLTLQRPKQRQLVSLFLTLSLTFRYSSVFIVNLQHISHLVRCKKCQNTCFILEKREKSKFNRLQFEVFFLPSISLPEYKPPHPNIDPSNLSFVHLSVYIRPGRINRILRYTYFISCK